MSSPNPESIAIQLEMCRMLLSAPTPEALGSTAAFLQHLAGKDPDVLRRVFREPCIKEGFRGISLLELLNRVCA